MEDSRIVQMYWDRDEQAIDESNVKYGGYCTAIARNILGNQEDAQECVNDTWLGAWNSMPPHRPDILSAFLGRITRNISFNRYKLSHAEKRGGGEQPLVLEELGEIVSGRDDVEGEVDRQELAAAIDAFLSALPEEKQRIFVCRYWYSDPISAIARRFHKTEGAVTMSLRRMRGDLRVFLSNRGFEL